MNFVSHLFISRVLYKYFKSEIELNGWAFAFGNVKPDLPPACFEARHTLENYIAKVNERTDQLANGELTLKEFSVKLGEVCHFACDFFCYYHSNLKLHKKNIFHFIYEICLQLQLNLLQLKKKLKIPIDSGKPYNNFFAFIFEMRHMYFTEARSMKKDIEYALRAANGIFETILVSVNKSLEEAWQPEEPVPSLLDIKGDNYESRIVC
ncbi:MAG: zinc dependent phospholipase C family protein [Eubacteriales bacterium]